jgi:hypothetical protein
MFLNIITPCSRPHLLHRIAESINIPKENYRWIVVFDSETIPDSIPECEAYFIKDTNSVCGNAQRNLAIDLVTEGYIYFNDDDTIMHPQLWDNIKDLTNDFIHFDQEEIDGSIRLKQSKVRLSYIDSHNFIVHTIIVGNERFVIHRRDADGVFAENCYNKSKTSKYIPKVLSTYNALRK